MSHKPVRGMTLLELVVVLAILAVVTSIAVASFTAVEDETRRTSSADLIDRVERATIGVNTSETTSLKDVGPSFLTDTGRLPKVQGTQPELYLRELWEKPTDLIAYRQVTPIPPDTMHAGDLSDLLIGCGWRGPYLTLGVGQSGLFDGYGNPLVIDSVPTSHPIALYRGWLSRIQSFGSDGLTGPTTLPITPAHDIPLTPQLIFDPNLPESLFPSLSITASGSDGAPLTAEARVHLIYPDSTNVNGYIVQTASLSSTTTTSHIFAQVPIGPRIIRIAYNSKKYTFRFVIPRGGIATGLSLELK